MYTSCIESVGGDSFASLDRRRMHISGSFRTIDGKFQAGIAVVDSNMILNPYGVVSADV
jgi:hypothetical protein